MRFINFNKLLLVAACLGISACSDKNQPEAEVQVPEVGVYTVISQPVSLTTDLPGRTAAFRVAEVRPQVNGIILQRLFEEGADVAQGQQLYQIDDAVYQANYNKLKANLENSERLADRFTKLRKSGAISKQDYDDAFYAWKQAEADIEVARINLIYSKVLSPISGRIGRSNVTEGALVTNGQPEPLAIVQQIDPIYVDVTQPVAQILSLQNKLAKGYLESKAENQAEVSLKLEDNSIYPLKGTLQFSEISVDQTTGSVTLRAQFPNPDGKLLPGMFVHAQLHEGVNPNGILIPQQAVMRDLKGNPTAWVVNADNVVERRELNVERTMGNCWLVNSGVVPGDRIVTEGFHRIKAGSVVAPVPAENINMKISFEPSGNQGGRQ